MTGSCTRDALNEGTGGRELLEGAEFQREGIEGCCLRAWGRVTSRRKWHL